MNSEAISQAMSDAPDYQLWLCILMLDRRHQQAALSGDRLHGHFPKMTRYGLRST